MAYPSHKALQILEVEPQVDVMSQGAQVNTDRLKKKLKKNLIV